MVQTFFAAARQDTVKLLDEMLAAGVGHVEMVKLLLEKGANPKLLTENNYPARTIASEKGHQRVLEILQGF